MLLVALAAGLGLLALPALARRVGSRLHPSEWARLSVIAIGGGALVIEVSLGLYALPTLGNALGLPQVAELCARMLAPLTPGGTTTGWAAATASIALGAVLASGWSQAHRDAAAARIERCLGRHDRLGDHELVVLPTRQPVAVSVPALPDAGTGRGQIVVSEGLLAALGPQEAGAVLTHEAAHLRHGHHRYLAVAAAVDRALGWLPLVPRSTAALRLALERWADEDATAAEGGRPAVRDALLTVVAAMLAAEPSMAAFSTAETVGERLDALDTGPPRPLLSQRLRLYFPGLALGAVVVIVLSWSLGQCAG